MTATELYFGQRVLVRTLDGSRAGRARGFTGSPPRVLVEFDNDGGKIWYPRNLVSAARESRTQKAIGRFLAKLRAVR